MELALEVDLLGLPHDALDDRAESPAEILPADAERLADLVDLRLDLGRIHRYALLDEHDPDHLFQNLHFLHVSSPFRWLQLLV